ncbi:hypothetical protein M752DRAFT_284460 [Aspergillus phoenicis ATCC 13157]|uniref:MADS-box domain-containing protein n=2 Tax=Aspergillus TaxID=5052 RepID=A0A370PHP6_ASPPH|nr:hypothetical protein BO87DRAFT_401928 [Aspergillus neoniger CBS 115656]PYH28823.1 hypothetical protein BO87DRAFT_401928 [Aspergillus neoniger CBS 115656]RDK41726.1 hypothetical protein M752DRAFT_284460 [Aspergillus phoenicis ATCC 13157]
MLYIHIFHTSAQDWNAAGIDPMASKREQEQERKRVKNLQERLKRRKDRLTQGLHDYALLADAKVYMLIQDRRGGITEYRSTPDRKFPPTYAQIRRLFPSASLLTPESFGVAVSQSAKADRSSKPTEHFSDPTVEMFADDRAVIGEPSDPSNNLAHVLPDQTLQMGPASMPLLPETDMQSYFNYTECGALPQ